jgi:hypothetical protein
VKVEITCAGGINKFLALKRLATMPSIYEQLTAYIAYEESENDREDECPEHSATKMSP